MKDEFKISIKGPRTSKAEFATHVINEEMFERFLKEHPKYKGMKFKEFMSHWKEIAQTIRTEGVFNDLGVKLGFYLGELKTQFLPHKFKATSISATNEIGEKSNHLNIKTRGKVAKIKWERRLAVSFNRMLQFYGFEPDRQMNTLAKKHLDEHPELVRVARVTTGGKRTWK